MGPAFPEMFLYYTKGEFFPKVFLGAPKTDIMGTPPPTQTEGKLLLMDSFHRRTFQEIT